MKRAFHALVVAFPSTSSNSFAFQSAVTSSSTSRSVTTQLSTRRYSAISSSSAVKMTKQIENRVALLQVPVAETKTTNLQTASEYLEKAYNVGAKLAVLPEIWNSPYATAAFKDYAEVLPDVGDRKGTGPSSTLMMTLAKEYNMLIVGGSIPEECNNKIYNTCLIIDSNGEVVGKHRKAHLFDVDVPGGICFKESETLTAGDEATHFDCAGLGRIGVGICYDIRFPEYAMVLTQIHKCKVLVFPGAFNLTTGPAHWELLQRARAVDGQCYVLSASPARSPPPPNDSDDKTKKKYPHYSAWGHSTVVSPWGEVIATCDEKPGMVVADLDMTKVEDMRTAIPTMIQKRDDLYRLTGR